MRRLIWPADPRSFAISPVFGDLEQLPPTLIQVGAAEPLLRDAVDLAARAFEQGATVRLGCWDGMLHVFQAFAPRLEEANDALRRAAVWLHTLLLSSTGERS